MGLFPLLLVAWTVLVNGQSSANLSNAAPSTSLAVGDFVAQGLGLISSTASDVTRSSPSGVKTSFSNGTISSVNGLPTAFPFSSDPTWTVPASGNGSSYASACNTENIYYEYLSTSSQYYGSQSVTSKQSSIWTVHNYTASLTTLCDGHARVIGSLTPTATFVNTSTIDWYASASVPSPTCSINTQDCSALWESWSEAMYTPSKSRGSMEVYLDPDLTAMVTGDLSNGDSTTVKIADGPVTSPPVLTIRGTKYEANKDTSYYIQTWPMKFDFLQPNGTLTLSDVPASAWDFPQCETYIPKTTTSHEPIAANQTAVTRTASYSSFQLTTTERCDCTIAGNSVQLLYFPVTTEASRNMCQAGLAEATICPFASAEVVNASMSAIPPNGGVNQGTACPYVPFNRSNTENSGPYTVSDGYTLYENRAYISFDVLSATRQCGYTGGVAGQLAGSLTVGPSVTNYVGSVHSHGIVEVATSDVYSVCGYHYFYDSRAYSFNFADLNEPVPASAFLCQPKCAQIPSYPSSVLQFNDFVNGESAGAGPASCNMILDKQYNPQILVPPQMRALDPAWETCLLKLEGLYDPPQALTAAASMVVPTLAPGGGSPGETGASPASGLESPSAPRTTALGDSLPMTVAGPSPAGPSPADPSPADTSSPGPDVGGIVASLLGGNTVPATADPGDEQANPDPPNAGQQDPVSGEETQAPALSQASGPSAATFAIGSNTAEAQFSSGNAIIQAGTAVMTIDPGNVATIGTAVVSNGPSGLVVVGTLNVLPVNVTPAPQALSATTLENGEQVYVNDGATLSPGGPATTIDGTVYSADPAGLVVDGTTQGGPEGSVVTVGTAAITSIGNGAYAVDGTTLSVGDSRITIDGTAISVGTAGLIIGGSTTAFQDGVDKFTGTDGRILTASQVSGNPSEVFVDGTTLTRGGSAQVVDGATMSVGESGIIVNGTSQSGQGVGSATSASAPATTSATSAASVGSLSVVAILMSLFISAVLIDL